MISLNGVINAFIEIRDAVLAID